MDAAFFRFLGPELADAVQGVRFDTVFSPAPGFWTLAFTPPVSIYPASPDSRAGSGNDSAGCRFLLVRVHPRAGILFLSPAKPVNPLEPPAKAMWLRKRLRGRKVVGAAVDWPRRRLALELSPGEGSFLLLSMEDDPVVLDRLPDDFGKAPAWGTPGEALADGACPRSLRAALSREDEEDRPALLESFLAGRAAGFFLRDSEMPAQGKASGLVRGDARPPSSGKAAKPAGSKAASVPEGPLPWPPGGASDRFRGALEAAAAHGRTVFFGELAPREEDPGRARIRKAKRLAHLDHDQERLEALIGQGVFGEAVAANLSVLEPRSKTGPKVLDHPSMGPVEVPFDPALTVLENMERFFRKAAKGRRGLGHVERLRSEAEAAPPGPGVPGAPPGASAVGRGAGGKPAGISEKTARTGSSGPRKGQNVALHRFRSSDGFLILRGKNSAANHKLLSELASPFDYWFHAEGGPGAHVIVKRDHPGQDVPEKTLREAAVLAGLASWRASDAKAAVLVAQCSEVRKMKGAPLGQVRLDSARTILVELDPSLEERLCCRP